MQQRATLTTQKAIEQEIHNLNEELRTINVAHAKRKEFTDKLETCAKQVQTCGGDGDSLKKAHKELHNLDRLIAFEALHQAESEISKSGKTSAEFLALENIRKDLERGALTPSKARREIKEIERHQR